MRCRHGANNYVVIVSETDPDVDVAIWRCRICGRFFKCVREVCFRHPVWTEVTEDYEEE